MTDAELVERAKGGDTAAFGELVDRHRAAVFRAALAALGSHTDADDVAQDAFVAAFRRLGGFRGDSSFKTWLLTIAWNHAINRRRTRLRIWRYVVAPRARHEEDAAADPYPHDAPSQAPTPEQSAASRELSGAIRSAIRALSPKLRDTLLLAQAGEYSYEEIASMLGAPLGTIKWRVAEARRAVKQRLREQGHGDVV